MLLPVILRRGCKGFGGSELVICNKKSDCDDICNKVGVFGDFLKSECGSRNLDLETT